MARRDLAVEPRLELSTLYKALLLQIERLYELRELIEFLDPNLVRIFPCKIPVMGMFFNNFILLHIPIDLKDSESCEQFISTEFDINPPPVRITLENGESLDLYFKAASLIGFSSNIKQAKDHFGLISAQCQLDGIEMLTDVALLVNFKARTIYILKKIKDTIES